MSSPTARALGPALAVLALLAATRPGHAQGGPTWNRKVESIAVLPSPTTPGQHDVYAALSVGVNGLTTPTDLSMTAELLVNGTTVASQTLVASGGGGLGACQSCCDAAGCPGGDCVVLSTSPCICNCGFASTLTSYPGVPLQPGDEIMVLLRPAPGAVPEQDSSDDARLETFGGGPRYWNRRIRSLSVTPSPSAPLGGGPGDQFFDVWVEVSIDAQHDGILDLSTDADLLVNGVLVASTSGGGGPLTLTNCDAGCGSDCAFDPSGAPIGTCVPTSPPLDCVCTVSSYTSILFPTIPVDPDDELVVILRPVPGALPELPPFEPDDEEGERIPCRLCESDIDGDGDVGVGDLLKVLADWGSCAPQ
ncbi:MAG: hypothetical protein ACYTG1_07175 [Planctomycetota bacterium]|jgi:hypothetical protein